MLVFDGPEGSTIITERNKKALRSARQAAQGGQEEGRRVLRRGPPAGHGEAPGRRFRPEARRREMAGRLVAGTKK